MKKLLIIITVLLSILAFASCDKQATNTLSGVALSEFSIVYSESDHDYSARAAEYIRDEIKERCGINLPLVTDKTPEAEHEILVGATSREASHTLDADCEGLEFAIYSGGGDIALEGDYFVIAAAAYFFVETYIPEADFAAEIPEGESVHEPITETARNFILLIGDGMGVYQTKLFDYFENDKEYGDGEGGFYGYMLPYRSFAKTNSLSGTTDSAAAGTALASGYKTDNGRVGMSSKAEDLTLITELLLSRGMGVGVMSTEKSTGATPSAFSAHALDRDYSETILKCQTALEREGMVIDCGYDYYTKKYMSVIENHITDTLGEIEDEDGFFLMYEEAHIDKHSHSNDMQKTFDALVRFNQAIARFMEYAFYNPDTMIIITADHETGELLPGEDGKLHYSRDGHTSADVPVFAYGKGAEVFGGEAFENTQIPITIAAFLGISDFGDRENFEPLK